MVKGIIYEFRNTINNKYYVGQTMYPQHRYLDHKRAKGDNIFDRAIRKYGFDNFEYKVVNEYEASDVYELKDILNDAEIRQIELRDSYNNGYNMTIGGGGSAGYTASEETKQKQRDAKKDFVPWHKGKTGVYSDVTLKQISESMKGKSPWNKGKTNIYSDVTLKKMSDAKKDNFAPWNKGKTGIYSEETKQKMGATKKGKHWKLVDGKRVWY